MNMGELEVLPVFDGFGYEVLRRGPRHRARRGQEAVPDQAATGDVQRRVRAGARADRHAADHLLAATHARDHRYLMKAAFTARGSVLDRASARLAIADIFGYTAMRREGVAFVLGPKAGVSTLRF